MRNAGMTIWVMVMLVVYSSELPKAMGTILDDGEIHEIDYYLNEDIIVDDDPVSGGLTTVKLLPGGSVNWLIARQNSQVTMSGGSVGRGLCAWDNSQVTMSAGSVEWELSARDNGQITMSGGSVGQSLVASDNGQITMSGGSVDNLCAFDNSQVTMSGGSVEGSLYAGWSYNSYNSTLTISGSNFAINGHSADYGEYGPMGEYSIRGGILTGTLANGDLLDNGFSIFDNSKLILIPEPATLLLLGLGGLVLRKKRY